MPMKIAIVGSGIAGLACAYRLSVNPEFKVTLIDRGPKLGLAANCVDVTTDDGNTLTGDIPSRMFNAINWPCLSALYDEAGILTSVVKPTQSFSRVTPDGHSSTFLTLANAMEPSLSTRWLKGSTRLIASEAKRLKNEGEQDLLAGLVHEETLSQYLSRRRYSDQFIKDFLYPTLSSTVCTCSYASLERYPANVILAALSGLTGGVPLMRLAHSACDVALRLTAGLSDIRLNCHVDTLDESGNGVTLSFSDGSREVFDRVVIATQANTALKQIAEVDFEFAGTLRAIDYEDVNVVIHRDRSFMPAKKSDWSTFNMTSSQDGQSAMCTVWMNCFHDDWIATEDIFQTIHPIRRPIGILTEVRLQRPVVTLASRAAVAEFASREQPDTKVLLAGSWAAPGIPLLESGVQSAWNVCQQIESRLSKRPD
ncbi:MAG: FAD-dependent oxidoreductase [Pirellulaceae bacterium]